tara:strand:+ start:781 stop:1470 length:690 start_codon:yes stop_codon:yes gene_type:complete
MREILEIREQLVSEDIDVLEQSLRFASARGAQEAERGKAAEARATAMLAILGILAGFIVPLVGTIEAAKGDGKWTLLVLFLGSLLFLVKGLYNAVRVLGVSKMYRLEIDTVFDFQPLARSDALREEIAGLIWEYRKAVQPNTEKLFRLHRCQRSGLIAIIFFMLFGIFLLAAREKWLQVPLWAAGALGVLAALLLVFGDNIFERLGIWGTTKKMAPATKPPEAKETTVS